MSVITAFLKKYAATSSDALLCLSNGSKPNDIQFAMIQDKDKKHIFTFEKLEPSNIWQVC